LKRAGESGTKNESFAFVPDVTLSPFVLVIAAIPLDVVVSFQPSAAGESVFLAVKTTGR
jgi:hypothetical protein